MSGGPSGGSDSVTLVAGEGGTLEGSGTAGGTSPRLLAAGTIVDDSFEIERVLGAGGMGVVYRARDLELDRHVALKLAHASSDPDSMARLLREARAMARLTHPNVITVHEVGVVQGQVFIAMELVEGDNSSEWLLRRRREVPEILEVFVQAGRGLAAAHAVDLVHRDFKPDNVLVGHDGRVRVGDFGLARAAEAEAISPTATHRGRLAQLEALVEDKLTTTGALLGTPAYMAPEQYGGARVDARADQFAFCVALYEALYGRRPFAGRRPHEVFAEIVERGPTPPPSEPAVPRRVKRALVRGLSADPAARFPDMDALLRRLDLQAARSTRRRVGVTLVGGGALVVGLVAGDTLGEEQPCRDAADPVQRRWTDHDRASLRDAFAHTGLAYAGASAESTIDRLDAYALELARARTEACEATHDSHRQSAALLDLRYACLDRALGRLEELLALLEAGDAEVVARAVDAAAALPPISRCADLDGLRAQVPAPEDAATAAAVERARRELTRLDARFDLELYAGGDRTLADVEGQARALAYAPLLAEVRLARARLDLVTGHPEQAKTAAEDAFFEARGVGHDAVAWQAASLLVYVAAHVNMDAATGRLWLRHAAAELRHRGAPDARDDIEMLQSEATVLDREGQAAQSERILREALSLADTAELDELQRAQLVHRLAIALDGQARYAQANEAYAQALAAMEHALGREHPRLADVLSNMSINYVDTGRPLDAIPLSERAIAIVQATLGPETEELVGPLINYGVALQRAGRIDDAVSAAQRAIDVTTRARGEQSPDLPRLLSNLSVLESERANHELALAHIERGLGVMERLAATHTPEYALYLSNHASALSELGRHAEAVPEFERARDLFAVTSGPRDIQSAGALHGLGISLRKLGRKRDAIAPLEQALALREPPEVDPLLRADTQLSLAIALREAGRERERARALLEAALAVYRAEGRTERAAQAQAELTR